jgi:malate synthase
MTIHIQSNVRGVPLDLPAGVVVNAVCSAAHAEVLTFDALAFVADLERQFRERRLALLATREWAQVRLDAGGTLDFLEETRAIREGGWRVGDLPEDLRDRTVEITGPVDRKMIINALNSGANVFMADFEDSNSPTWENAIDGQINLRDAIRREIDFLHPDSGKMYRLAEQTATLMVRPRGWHLIERHVEIDGEPISAGLFDFGLFLFHNAGELIRRGSGPYFYLPKIESYLEARLWDDVFVRAQHQLGLAVGTIKATVLIETIPGAFQMDEILHELREHSVGLNCGRWDYIFSFIKRFRASARFVLPDRGSVGMDRHFLRSYSQLLIQTCHRRGAQAMGGMAAQIPIKNDPVENGKAMAKVHADKKREAQDGHDGTWVAHPGLIEIARAEFDDVFAPERRLTVMRDDVAVTAADLLTVPEGDITEDGLRQNLSVGVQYLEAWLRGSGCVPIRGLMEDAATAEISRTQVWQWIRHGARLVDGRLIDRTLVRATLAEELATIREDIGDRRYTQSRFDRARELFQQLIESDDLPEFLTIAAYQDI